MVELLAAVALAPWAQPLRFRPLIGWRTGASGTVRSAYGPDRQVALPKESSAWIAMKVRYRDRATADPPNATLVHLPPAETFSPPRQNGKVKPVCRTAQPGTGQQRHL